MGLLRGTPRGRPVARGHPIGRRADAAVVIRRMSRACHNSLPESLLRSLFDLSRYANDISEVFVVNIQAKYLDVEILVIP
jgi:hypothetical protein